MKLLAQTDWDDVEFDWGYTFSFPYCIKWYQLPSGGFLRCSQPYRVTIVRDHWWQDGVQKKGLLGDVHTVPMSYGEIFSDMLNKGLAQKEVTELMKALKDLTNGKITK